MKRKKQILAWLIAFAMVVAMIPADASAKNIKLKNCAAKKVMAVGSTFAIQTNQKASKLKFTSSKKKVASVTAEGVIQAKKKGKAVITITSGKNKKKINVTVKAPVGYTISKKAGSYDGSVQPKVKAKKGYVVYYNTGKKFKSSAKIKANKSKAFTISKTTTLKLYAVKATKKISNLNKIKKNDSNYNEYLYVISESAGENPATPSTPGATTTTGGITTGSPAPASSAPESPATDAPIQEPESSNAPAEDVAEYVAPALGEYDDTDMLTEAGEDAIEITIPTQASGSKTETANYTFSKKNKLTIIAPGTYVIRTESTEIPSDGLIEVDPETDGLVHLILDGVNLTSSNNTAPDSDTGLITVKKSTQRAVITVKKGTVTTLTDTGATGIDEDDGISTTYTGGISCKKIPLTINGAGTLNISTKNGNGIKATQALKILDTTITVRGAEDNPAGHNGITGKTEVFIKNANLDIYADGDALKTTLDKNDIAEEPAWAELGNMDIDGGTHSIVSANGDAINVYRTLNLNPVSLTAISKNEAKSSENGDYRAIKAGTTIYIPETAGNIFADTTETSDSSPEDALNCDGHIRIDGGIMTLDSADDGIHADEEVRINGGNITINAQGKSIDSDGNLFVNGGILVAASGVEMEDVLTSGSTQDVVNVALPSSQPAGTHVVLKDASDNVVLEILPSMSFQYVVISCEGMVSAGDYTVWYGSSLEELTQVNH